MYFKSLFILVFSFLFIACSSKAPEIKKEDELTQANKCQILEKRDHKLKCYDELLGNNSFAQLRVGIYFAQKKEYKKSLDLLNKSYESKNPYSNLALAFMYFNGFGVKQDLKESHNLLQDTKDINPNASYQLARFYLQGIYVKKDANKGIEFLEKAANKGMKKAQKRLFNIYSKGLFGIQKDEIKASYWGIELKSKKVDNTENIYKL